MPHSFNSVLLHVVFSTKRRRPDITAEIQPRLWSYLGGMARERKIKALAIGGFDDHIHLLLSLPATLAPAKAIQELKAGSSKWIHDSYPNRQLFAWQEGYGAFSIGISQVEGTVEYIANQAEHHKKIDFQQEFIIFLNKHGIEYDERYLWG